EVEATPGDRDVAREAVHDAAGLANARLGEERERLGVGVTAVDQHGLPHAAGQGELGAEAALLRLARREGAEEVEAAFADRDDARRPGQALDLRERLGVGRG